jgi:carbon storage regulator
MLTVVGGAAAGQGVRCLSLIALYGTRDGDSNGSEMLVLTRKTNQSIMIGDDVEVAVLAISRDKIRLGITAPRDVPVFRKEVYLSIKGDTVGDEGEAVEKVKGALDALKDSD